MRSVEDYNHLKPVKPTHRIAYGNHPEQFGDLYLPNILPEPHSQFPVIILLHGGCWRAQYGLSQLGQLSQALTQRGFAVWNLEFRRLGNGGGWPVTFEDVAQGTDFLQTIALNYHLDLARVISMGHSAGGHLALWLAGRHHLPETSQLKRDSPLALIGVVSLAGIPDLISGVAQRICRGACEELVGGLPAAFPERYHETSPHFLLPFNVPHWHLVGENDPIVPVDYLRPFIEKARQQDTVHFEIIPEIGHFEMVMPDTGSWPVIKEVLKQAVTRLIRNTGNA